MALAIVIVAVFLSGAVLGILALLIVGIHRAAAPGTWPTRRARTWKPSRAESWA